MRGEVLRRFASVAAVALVAAVVACGEDRPREIAQPITTNDPGRAFAPQVRLDADERWLPMSAAHFLSFSGLEWAGGPCQERDLTARGTLPPGEPSPLPRLDPARLGRSDATYAARAARADCAGFRPTVYTSDQPSRPFDDDRRAAGLPVGEGFSLDIAREGQPGERTPGADGRLQGVSAYYASRGERVRRRAGIRFSYWLLFGYEDAVASDHEGDWERIDVLVQRVEARVFRPVAVEYRRPSQTVSVPWNDVQRVRVTTTHPIVYLARGTHTPRPTGECDACIVWSTWRWLRDIRREPWWGYGGGWGATDRADATSGPSGPTSATVTAPPPGR